MADDIPDYYTWPVEAADSVSPGAGGFKIDDGRWTHPYYIDGSRWREETLDILGYNLESDEGHIDRHLPARHPQFTFLFASSINGVDYGVPEVVDAEYSPEGEGETIAPYYGLYPRCTLTVEFLQRPYHVLSNDQIEREQAIWYDEDGVETLCEYVNEWDRFCEIDEVFDPKIITATQGQLWFLTESGADPDLNAFPGSPRIPYPEYTLKMTWRQVPYRYISSRRSWLKKLSHRVNQLPWEVQGYTFEPGELLYLGYTYRRYTPPFPPLLDDGSFELEKWVDIDLNFSIAYREGEDVPDLPNGNWIAHGHNVLPWFGPGTASSPRRKFFYVGTFNQALPNDRTYWVPVFESAPLQLLFMDPDYIQPTF